MYAIDYSDEDKEIYRIGMTNNMNMRKKIYNTLSQDLLIANLEQVEKETFRFYSLTHTLHKQKVAIIKESPCPIQLESCVKVLLYNYRYKNNKDFFICSLDKIKSALRTCIKSLICVNKGESKTNNLNQIGGSNLIFNKKLNILLKNKKILLQRKINRLNNIMNN